MVPGTSPYLICSTVMVEDMPMICEIRYIRDSARYKTVPLDRVLLLDQGWNRFWSTLILDRLRCCALPLIGRDGGRNANA